MIILINHFFGMLKKYLLLL